MSMLEVSNIDVYYGAIHALRDISLKVEKGQIVTLLGANGAGKSSTLRTISGLLNPKAGDIKFEGRSIKSLKAHHIVHAGIAHVPEGRGIFANLSVSENLALGAYTRKDRSAIAKDRDRALELFPRIKERLAQNAGTLSGGEQQMLAIARALMTKPKLMMLDEPSLGLAPQIVQTIFQIIREINEQGTTILLVEQNANIALKTADYGYVLEVGSIVIEDEAKTLAASEDIQKAYLGVSH